MPSSCITFELRAKLEPPREMGALAAENADAVAEILVIDHMRMLLSGNVNLA